MNTKKEQLRDWEEKVIDLIKEYGRQAYLVSEENHPEIDEVRAMNDVIVFIHSLLSTLDEERIMNKNELLLEEFTRYCKVHPSERFWQALRNWSGQAFIIAGDLTQERNTFYWEHKNK